MIDPTNPYPHGYTGHVRARLADGSVIEERQPHLRGGAHERLSRAEIEEKFGLNVRPRRMARRSDSGFLAFARTAFDSRRSISQPSGDDDGSGRAAGELAGKVAVVTGAGRNIGRAIALSLASAGAAIVVNARQSRDEAEAVAAEIERQGGRAIVALADVADPDQVARMADAAHKAFGRIDVLVNNAAVRREAPIDSIDFAEWRQIMSIVLDGAFICVKACLPHLRKSGAGAIVNIGGLTGHTGAKGRPHVIAAKSGLVGLTRALAHDLAARPHQRQLRRAGPDRHGAQGLQQRPAGPPQPCTHADRRPRQA